VDIGAYLDEVRSKFESGQATEHSYRPALQALFESIDPALTVINEPKQSEGGMPDFLFQRGDVPIGWAEAKDVNKDVIKLKGYSKEQRKRYEAAYPNLIYTNGVDFEFIREGEPVHFVSIADFLIGLQPNPERFGELERQLKLFAEQKPISIRSASKLADMMAAKAAIIKDELEIALADDRGLRGDLGIQYKSFKANLLPQLTPDEFADLYAETITYGMFAARFHDTDLSSFSRQEAMEDLPASNPFLKGLFRYIAGDLPPRLTYVVDDLVQVMRASDPHSLFNDFGKFTARNDPFVHFYEDFLAAYNPKKRKSRGVWYTPEPVVDFIVRAVDEVLRTEFGLADGLADTSKVTVDWDTGETSKGNPVTVKKEVHKVQILDPATGTGTFLAKAVQLIADRVKTRASGKWSAYVEEDLLPRLHGFELLMASYAMCHMKLDMMLDQTGYKPSAKPPRLSVWLTNALEPADRDIADLFMPALVQEAKGAARVKRQTPIMCVIGNPPYSGESANKGDHIMTLMEAYKKEPGGKEKLKERNPKWINDDYVKFMRMAEDLIAKNPSGGILGFITNHGYLDNPTFRGMRWHLLNTFERVYILDLHGNLKKKEVSPDGSPDANVFDIQPGVAILIAVKRAGLSRIRVGSDLWGSRASKNKALHGLSIRDITDEIAAEKPAYRLTRLKHDDSLLNTTFDITNLFEKSGVGLVSARDNFAYGAHQSLTLRMQEFASAPREASELHRRFDVAAKRGWDILDAHDALQHLHSYDELVRPILYRPFDETRMFFHDDIMWRTARKVSEPLLRPNLAIVSGRQGQVVGPMAWNLAFIVDAPVDFNFFYRGGGHQFLLYDYPAEGEFETDRLPNFDPKLYVAICKAAGIDAADQARPDEDFRAATGEARSSEVKVFDYIYGVLHSPAYRETFPNSSRSTSRAFPIPLPRRPSATSAKRASSSAACTLWSLPPSATRPIRTSATATIWWPAAIRSGRAARSTSTRTSISPTCRSWRGSFTSADISRRRSG
jgi:hypothetical protein